jgi:hypothetical protein
LFGGRCAQRHSRVWKIGSIDGLVSEFVSPASWRDKLC